MDDLLDIADYLEDPGRWTIGNCLIGFDGFTDEVLSAVDTRSSPNDYQKLSSMTSFGQRMVEAAGKSCNIELVTKRTKIGGQAPILANALVEGGHALTLVGLVGAPKIEPLFEPLTNRCQQVVSLGPSSQTLAVEFDDGKVMLGKHASVHQVTWETLLQHLPLPQLIALIEKIDLFVSGNWTMLMGTNQIWRGLVEAVLPQLSERLRWLYVDLADPAKRSADDLREGLELLQQLTTRFQIVLGLNVAEGQAVSKALGLPVRPESLPEVKTMAEELQRHLQLAQIVVHAIDFSVTATAEETVSVAGPGCKAILTTGGGDNFNAGYCHGLLNRFTNRQALLCGVAVSGFYVNQGRSPTMKELATFLRLWHNQPHGLLTAVPI